MPAVRAHTESNNQRFGKGPRVRHYERWYYSTLVAAFDLCAEHTDSKAPEAVEDGVLARGHADAFKSFGNTIQKAGAIWQSRFDLFDRHVLEMR